MNAKSWHDVAYNPQVALLISLYFPPEIGGGSTGAWNRALVLQKLGFIVFVLCGFPAYPSGKITDKKYRRKILSIEKREEINVIRVRLPSISHKGYLRRLILFVSFVLLALLYIPLVLNKTGRLSLVYARNPVIFSNLAGLCYSTLQRSFYIYEAPDLWPEELGVFHSPLMPLIKKIGKSMAKISYQTPNVVVTISLSAMEYIYQNYRPSRPVFGIPVGVNPSSFKPIERSEALQDLITRKIVPPQVQGKFLVIYSGIITAAQNVHILVEVAKKLKSNDVVFLIVGDGEDRIRLQELVVENNLQNLFLIGQQPRELMPTIIGAADVCTVTLSQEDIFHIAIPTKFFEYLASSKPIIAICKGELADIVETHGVGYAFRSIDSINKIADSLEYLKNSPEAYAQLVGNCKEATAVFSIDSISLKFKEILDRYRTNY